MWKSVRIRSIKCFLLPLSREDIIATDKSSDVWRLFISGSIIVAANGRFFFRVKETWKLPSCYFGANHFDRIIMRRKKWLSDDCPSLTLSFELFGTKKIGCFQTGRYIWTRAKKSFLLTSEGKKWISKIWVNWFVSQEREREWVREKRKTDWGRTF